jgi:hypothetical protein
MLAPELLSLLLVTLSHLGSLVGVTLIQIVRQGRGCCEEAIALEHLLLGQLRCLAMVPVLHLNLFVATPYRMFGTGSFGRPGSRCFTALAVVTFSATARGPLRRWRSLDCFLRW